MATAADPLELSPCSLLDALDDGLGLADPSGRVRWVNAVLGRGTREGLFKRGDDFAAAVERSFEAPNHQPSAGLHEVLEGRTQRFELPLRYGKPPRHWVSLVIAPFRVRSERWALFRLSDVTEAYAKDLVVRESEARWQRLVDGSPDIVFITDESSRMIYANRALEEQTGYTALRFQMAQAQNDLIHPADRARVAAFLAAFVESSETYSQRLENRFVTSDGRGLWYASIVSKTQYRGLPALQFVVHNITAEREAIEESAKLLEEARAAVRTRDEFLQVAAHELKTPLTSLRGFSQWLLRSGEHDAERRRRALATIDRQAAKLGQLVDRLLDVSQLCLGHLALCPQRADLVTVVRDAIDSVARPSAAEISLDAPVSLPVVADPVRLEQAVANLIDNAFRHGPHHGPVEVGLTALPPGWAQITVSDRGQGVPAEDRERIFEKFYQARGAFGGDSAGLGLGLHISREIVTLHGGTLSVETVDTGAGQHGARFRVTLPVAPT